jgi:hypothetical protein
MEPQPGRDSECAPQGRLCHGLAFRLIRVRPFSLVAVPVKAYTAAAPGGGEIPLNELHKGCNSRIQYKKVCPAHGLVRQAATPPVSRGRRGGSRSRPRQRKAGGGADRSDQRPRHPGGRQVARRGQRRPGVSSRTAAGASRFGRGSAKAGHAGLVFRRRPSTCCGLSRISHAASSPTPPSPSRRPWKTRTRSSGNFSRPSWPAA